MTPEEKELLLKDLSARIPYQPLCKITDTEYDFCECDGPLGYSLRDFVGNKVIIKPYLRSMFSMTEEEKNEFVQICPSIVDVNTIYGFDCNDFEQFSMVEDFLLFHHFDYRGLIEKGLALEAPEDMYNKE